MLLDCNTHITQNSTLTHTTIAITKFLKKRYLTAPPLRLHHTQQRHSLSEEYNPFRKNSSSLGQKPKSSKTQHAVTTIHFKKWSTSKLNCGQSKCWSKNTFSGRTCHPTQLLDKSLCPDSDLFVKLVTLWIHIPLFCEPTIEFCMI